jgi:predicted SprT family Zn-dependent metalloprotease
LQGLTNELARGLWPELDLTPTPLVLISEKSTRRAGMFVPANNLVVVARQYFEALGGHALTELLMHELCHWAAFHKGTWGSGQRPHGAGWQAEMSKVGLDPKEIYCDGNW